MFGIWKFFLKKLGYVAYQGPVLAITIFQKKSRPFLLTKFHSFFLDFLFVDFWKVFDWVKVDLIMLLTICHHVKCF